MLVASFLRHVLAQIIRLLLLNRIVTLGLVAVLLAAFVIMPLLAGAAKPAGTLGSAKPAQAAPATGGAGSQTTATANILPPDPSVETYVKGVLTFDANLMWSSLNPNLKAQLQSQNVTLETMKAKEAQEKSSGVSYDKAHYIGGMEGPSGLRYYFYLITASGKDSNGQRQETEGAFTFTVIPDAGIVDIGIK